MTTDRVTIRGTSEGVIISFGAGNLPRLLDELETHLNQKASFFKGGRVALQVGQRQLSQAQLESIGDLLRRHGMSLWAVESDSVTTREAAQAVGIEITLTAPPSPALLPTANGTFAGDTTVIRRTLRSGQIVEYPGHVIIIGDVNPGAEVRAGGNIIVWGRLRGTAHAGMNEQQIRAFVCALQLNPTQLRIGDHITRSPSEDIARDTVVPEIASVENGQIVAEPWPK